MQQQEGPSRDWQRDLLRLRQGEWEPTMDDLIRLDGVLARPKRKLRADTEASLF